MDIRKPVTTYVGKDGRVSTYVPMRTAKNAIEEKLKVLEEFYIVDDRNRETVRAQMKAAIESRPDVDFDRVLDNFAKRLINEKFG